MEQEIKVQLGVKLWPGDKGEIRQVALGVNPAVLININPIGIGEVALHIDASLFDHINEVYELFQTITEGLKTLVEEHTTTEGEQ